MDHQSILVTPRGNFSKIECETLMRLVGYLVRATDVDSGEQVSGVVMQVNLLDGTLILCAYQVGWKTCSMAKVTPIDPSQVSIAEFDFYFPIINALLDAQLQMLTVVREALATLQASLK